MLSRERDEQGGGGVKGMRRGGGLGEKERKGRGKRTRRRVGETTGVCVGKGR